MMRANQNLLNRMRLVSGLVLFAFLAMHLINHALGLISLDAMEAGRTVFLTVWRNPIGTVALLGGIVVHVALVMHALYRRRTLRGIGAGEVLQLLSGLAIPPLIALHVIANRLLHERFGIDDSYTWVLMSIWVADPLEGVKQSAVTLIAWAHGCIGIHYWLRLKPWYPRLVVHLYTLALLFPVLGLLGFVAGGREVEALWQDPAFRDRFWADLNLPEEAAAWAYQTRDTALWGMTAFLGLFGAGRAVHYAIERSRGLLNVTYPDGRRVTIQPGTTVLEASRQNGIPHASVCGGRGRCSTCRVRVADGFATLPDASEEEQKVLRRVGAPDGVRLACQLVPTADLSVVPLLPPGAAPKDGFRRPSYLQGTEREIAILFADLRSFTKFSEQKLPYDVVFVINQYFRYMGNAIEQANGKLDKFIGDGVMALFGLEQGAEQGCRDALEAARRMSAALEKMNQDLKSDLPEPMRIGIGIHIGHVIVGEMGYAAAVSITAIGDAVNTASRLETANKDFGSQLVVSKQVADRAGVDLSGSPERQLEVRGRTEPMTVYVFDDAMTLPET
ncbi:MAG: adenylate/guanylate cyclase domain-containing protein, partial [Minwuiales bacterium]|nr:adenylate/guanylate cyclase domain-containing protein [Minwuiales bacterium]